MDLAKCSIDCRIKENYTIKTYILLVNKVHSKRKYLINYHTIRDVLKVFIYTNSTIAR